MRFSTRLHLADRSSRPRELAPFRYDPAVEAARPQWAHRRATATPAASLRPAWQAGAPRRTAGAGAAAGKKVNAGVVGVVGAARRAHLRVSAGKAYRPAMIEPGQVRQEHEDMAKSLRLVAEQRGECSEAGCDEADLVALIASLRPGGGGNVSHNARHNAAPAEIPVISPDLQVLRPAVPPALAAMWRESAEWHFSKGHYDAFGLNLYRPSDVATVTPKIFGDWSMRLDWQEHEKGEGGAGVSVSDPGWVCVGACSEFDFYFCCFDADSPHFGHGRLMVNNCCEERPAWDDFALLGKRLLAWHAAAGDDPGSDDDQGTDLLAKSLAEVAEGTYAYPGKATPKKN